MIAKKLRIVFMGTPEFAVPSLKALVEGGYNVVGVVTAPDKPAGRGQKLHESDVKIAARELGFEPVSPAEYLQLPQPHQTETPQTIRPIFQPEKLKDAAFVEAMRALEPDLGIVIAFRMLPEIVWSMPQLGTFNLHASLLPQYRGAAPINWAVINGETETGITTFLLNHEIDKGAIVGQERMPIGPEDTVGAMYDKLMHAGTSLVTRTVDRIAAGDIDTIEQMHVDEHTLKPAPKIFKENCLIDWSWPGKRIVDFIRGLSPYPAAWTELHPEQQGKEHGGEQQHHESAPEHGGGHGKSNGGNGATQESEQASLTAKIFSASFEAAVHGEPCGTLQSDSRSFIRVACADGWILLGDVQIAGKKRLPVRELLLGWRDAAQYNCATPRP